MDSATTPNPLLDSLPRRATLEDWRALVLVDEPVEFIQGQLVRKAMATARHGRVQMRITSAVSPYDRQGGDGPGGWWLAVEVDMQLGEDGLRPDFCGWRRDKCPEFPTEDPALGVVTAAPDWVCEVLSKSTAARDKGAKMHIYHRERVGHYWLADPLNETITVYRWHPEGYLFVTAAGGAEAAHLEPFPAVDILPADLFVTKKQ